MAISIITSGLEVSSHDWKLEMGKDVWIWYWNATMISDNGGEDDNPSEFSLLWVWFTIPYDPSSFDIASAQPLSTVVVLSPPLSSLSGCWKMLYKFVSDGGWQCRSPSAQLVGSIASTEAVDVFDILQNTLVHAPLDRRPSLNGFADGGIDNRIKWSFQSNFSRAACFRNVFYTIWLRFIVVLSYIQYDRLIYTTTNRNFDQQKWLGVFPRRPRPQSCNYFGKYLLLQWCSYHL